MRMSVPTEACHFKWQLQISLVQNRLEFAHSLLPPLLSVIIISIFFGELTLVQCGAWPKTKDGIA